MPLSNLVTLKNKYSGHTDIFIMITVLLFFSNKHVISENEVEIISCNR